MKKTISVMLAAIMAAALGACVQVQPRAASAEPPVETVQPARMERYSENGVNIGIEVYDSWQYSTFDDGSSRGLVLTPPYAPALKFSIAYNEHGLGVCGTGLREDKATIAGCDARLGYYDGSDIWSFISIDYNGKSYSVTWTCGSDAVTDDTISTACSDICAMLGSLSLS